MNVMTHNRTKSVLRKKPQYPTFRYSIAEQFPFDRRQEKCY